MITLAIDTSGSTSWVAFLRPDGRVVELANESSSSHGEDLALLVQRTAEQAETDASAVKRIVIGHGPGSFTGLRIGFSFAEGVALATGAELVAACSLHAAAIMEGDCPVVVVRDARRVELFCGAYLGARVLKAPCIIAAAELPSVVASVATQCGAAAVRVLGDTGDQNVSGIQPMQRVASGLLRIANFEAAAKTANEISGVEPLYLRAVAAKTIAERSQGS